MFTVFIVGTAGSGKSLLTSSFADWLKSSQQSVGTINLDPGVVTLPYTPDLDIRDYVNVIRLMEEYRLGPNGALILAADLIAEQAEKLGSEIEDLGKDLILVDTPGQIEIFAFRASGPYIAKELTGEQKAIVYLFDSVFSLDPLNYVSNLFLSAAIYNRFLIPQIHVLSKTDLLPQEKVANILDWSTDKRKLEEAIEEELRGAKRLLSVDIAHTIYELELSFLLFPVSAKTNDGMTNLNATLERVLVGGDMFTY